MKLDSTKLRKLRYQNKLSQLELAESVGMSQSTIAKYEKDDSNVKFDVLIDLCTCLNVEPNDIMMTKNGESIIVTRLKGSKNGEILNDRIKSDEDDFKMKIKLLERVINIIERIV